MKKTDYIIILDFGSQYTQLIARRVRELGVYSEIFPYFKNIEEVISQRSEYNLIGIILSGGPSSVLEKDSPKLSKSNFEFINKSGVAVLGICYGLQLLSKLYGGKIHKGKTKEYGSTEIKVHNKSELFKNIKQNQIVWMSHGDSVEMLPEGFKVTAKSKNGIISGIENSNQNIYGLQFHPEVKHSECGKEILTNFVFKICKAKNLFKTKSFIDNKIKEIRNTVKNDSVILALSGGVDSSVAAVLMNKAIGNKLTCIHIDTGMMRKNESGKIVKMFKANYKLKLIHIDASKIFLQRLKNVEDPETKRKIIGKTFIEVFEKEAKKIKNAKYLVQGTLYPDVIESVSFKGPSVTIKSHHNVGGLPEKMKLKLIEPFRELFKDEVREIGKKLGLPKDFIGRHPFPGPGLAIRIMGTISKTKLDLLREVDEIYIDELKKNNLYNKIWQAFSVLLPVKSVGVMGDSRSYDFVVALRAVTSTDGMTADFFQFEKFFISGLSNNIVNNVRGVNRVVYDVTSKPPATIEWE